MRKATGVIACILALSFIAWMIFTLKLVAWDFRSNLWATAYLLWHGQSAYAVATLFPTSGALWFPQVIVLFAPLGLLPLYPATNLWLIMNIALLIALIWYLARQVSQDMPKPLFLFILVLSVALFPPTGGHLLLGQVDIVVMAAIIWGTIALQRDRIILSGFLFAVALIKPQLCIMVLPSVTGYLLFVSRERQKALKLLLMTCIFVIALILPLWIGNPNWIKDFISNYQHIPRYTQPSVSSWLLRQLGPLGLIVWFMLFITTLALSLRLWSTFEPRRAVLWSLALTTVISPYIWGWDFVVLLPLFIDTAVRLTNTPARITLFGFVLLCVALTLLSIQRIDAGNYVLWWIPYEMLTGIILSLKLGKNFGRSVLNSSA